MSTNCASATAAVEASCFATAATEAGDQALSPERAPPPQSPSVTNEAPADAEATPRRIIISSMLKVCAMVSVLLKSENSNPSSDVTY